MSIRVVPASQQPRMPWKNGGGETIEVAIHPQGSDLANFGWRISMATIAADGPFSPFPGVDRTLVLLRGKGVELDFAGLAQHKITQQSLPLAFPGEAAIMARLQEGAVTDLNVMSQRSIFKHRLLPRSTVTPSRKQVAWRIVLALEPITLRLGSNIVVLEAFDALICENEEGDLRSCFDSEAAFHVIEIDHI